MIWQLNKMTAQKAENVTLIEGFSAREFPVHMR